MTYKGYIFNKVYEDIPTLKNGKKVYLEKYICLDTETSHNHEEDAEKQKCWIYQWAFTFNGGIYYGRTPIQLCEKLKEISEHYQLSEQKRIKIYVHNLPYDFSYLVMFLYQYFGDPVSVLAYANHKVFDIAYKNGIEFMCTYKLSNDSLDRWSKKLNTQHCKLVGSIDYDKIRYQTTALNKRDWKYMFYDIIVLDECVEKQYELYNDNVASCPLTSTGYTRRELLRAYKGEGHHGYITKDQRDFKKTRLYYDTYIPYREEFSGGISQGNRNLKGQVVEADIRHKDFRSHYVSQKVNGFPMGRPVHYTRHTTIEFLRTKSDKYAIMCEIVMQDVRLKSKHITLPYLQTSHVLRHRTKNFDYVDDNGRIVAFKGQCRIYLDLNEFLFVLKQYDMKYVIKNTWASRLGPLPAFMQDTIDKHFKGKSDYKTMEKRLKKQGASRDLIMEAHINLMKSKNIVNGIYGVAATDPVRQEIELKENVWSTKPLTEELINEQLDNYYKSFNKCMRFVWGCYFTIYARLELMEFIELIGYDNFLYADTDSAFYISTPEIEERIEKRNKELYDQAIADGQYITTDDGKIITYNAFCDEDEDIIQFKFLHSKCYAYVTADGKLHSTIAGVQKRNGKTYEEDELGCIDNLKEGFTFVKCGGTKAVYVGHDIDMYDGNITCGGCIITRTTKTLNETDFIEREEFYYNDRY